MSDKRSAKQNKELVSYRLSPVLIAKLKKEADKTGLTATRIVEKALAASLGIKG